MSFFCDLWLSGISSLMLTNIIALAANINIYGKSVWVLVTRYAPKQANIGSTIALKLPYINALVLVYPSFNSGNDIAAPSAKF